MLVRIESLFGAVVAWVNGLVAVVVAAAFALEAAAPGVAGGRIAGLLAGRRTEIVAGAAAVLLLNIARLLLRIRGASRGSREGMIPGSARGDSGWVSLRAIEKSLTRVVRCLWEVDRVDLRVRRGRRGRLIVLVNYRALEGVNTVHLDHRIRAALKERVGEILHPRPGLDLDIMVNLVGLTVPRAGKRRPQGAGGEGAGTEFAGPRWPVEEPEKG